MPADGLPSPPLFELLASVRPTGRLKGYAICFHGTKARDIDLVAVPWTEEAAAPEVLVEAIREAVDGLILCQEPAGRPGYMKDHREHLEDNPARRPHGRLAWSIQLPGYGTYLDLSVMPRVPADGPAA